MNNEEEDQHKNKNNNNNNMRQECKIVMVGDSKVGKSALVHRVLHDRFLDVYIPTGFERYTATYDVNEQAINFTVWDTSGSQAYDSVRPLAYQDVGIFLLCFRLDEPDTLDNTLNKWYPEVRQHAPNVPIILCGCQNDQRQDNDVINRANNRNNNNMVASERALEVSRLISAATYVETSSRHLSTTAREAFEVAALAAVGRLNKGHLNFTSNTITTTTTSSTTTTTTISSATTTSTHQSNTPATSITEETPTRSIVDTGRRFRSKVDLKNELRDRTKSCRIM